VAPTGEPLATRSLTVGEATLTATLGPVIAREQVVAYREDSGRGSNGAQIPLNPPLDFALETIGVWLDLPAALGAPEAGLHALEHLLVNVLPLRLLSDRGDVGSVSDAESSPGGRVTLYDRYEGGIGLAEHAYQLLEALLEAAAGLLQSCPCADGCPSCTHLPGCTRGNDALDKVAALALLQGQRVIPAPRRAATEWCPGRIAAESESGGPDLARRLRRIAEEGLRERIRHVRPTLKAGDKVLGPDGPMVVLQVQGDRAKVQFQNFPTWTWERLSNLKLVSTDG
jgi:hypothetical protein